jgi:type IV secretory pathway component VirB8
MDFMFELNTNEHENLRTQFASSSWGGQRYIPFAFTEQGVAMLSGILNSERAINVNIAIMRAFVKMRRLMETHKELSKKIEELESKYDDQFSIVFEAIRQLIHKENEPRNPVGFKIGLPPPER